MQNNTLQITFEKGQGLGNQLWLYASLRGISNYHKFNYSINSYENFKGKNFLEIDIGNKNKKIENKFYEQLYFDKQLNNLACIYDESIENINKDSELNGFFQSERYFFNQDNLLSEWIKPSKKILKDSTKYKNDIILNIRGGEYKRHRDLLLPKSYWYDALKILKSKFDYNRVVIVTDDEPYSKWLFPKIEIISSSIEECYSALFGAKALAVSNSSFAYFPIKTRLNKPFVLAPIYWARYDNKYQMWASPANLYKDWFYKNKNNKIFSYSDLEPGMIRNENEFKNNYRIGINSKSEIIINKYTYVPKFVKNYLKQLLNKINPRKF